MDVRSPGASGSLARFRFTASLLMYGFRRAKWGNFSKEMEDAMTTPSEPGTPVPSGPAGTPLDTRSDPVDLVQPTVTVASYGDYASAQRAVDYLSDNGFPVERSAIIGTNLRLVETVLGRMTVGRAAMAGAASGAWLGLFIGFLFTLFSTSAWWAVLITSLIVGAFWGAVLGATA